MEKNKRKDLTVKYIYKNDDDKFIKILYQIYINNLTKLNSQKQKSNQV